MEWHEAAMLAKTDLTTELVKEFTELQGIVGGLYAKCSNGSIPPEADTVCDRGCNLRPVQAAIDGRLDSAHAGRRVLAHWPTRLTHFGHVRAGADSERLEGSICVATAGNGIVKIIAEQKLPVSLTELMSRRARSLSWHGSREEV